MTDHATPRLPANRARLVVAPAHPVAPGSGEIAIRAHAVAVNPCDRYIQAIGDVITGYLTGYLACPAVLSTGVAGDAVAVGPGVTRLRVGNRVLGHAAGLEKRRNRAADGAFQEKFLLLAHRASPVPADPPFEEAAALLLGLSTAACGLFQRDFPALAAPRIDPVPTGKVVLIWGGSISVGGHAIQLARLAGHEVVTTCSPGNNDHVYRLCASHVFEYRRGVSRKMIRGGAPINDDVGLMRYETSVAEALARGVCVAQSPAERMGRGLHHLRAAMEHQRRGASARKLVVTS